MPNIVAAQKKIAQKFGATFLPDNSGFTNRFAIPSESNPDVEYIVAQRKKSKEITCGCPHWKFRRNTPGFKPCKHLKALGPDLIKSFGGFYKGMALPASPPKLLKAKDPRRTKLYGKLYKLGK